MHAAHDGGVGHRQAALGHHLHQVPETELEEELTKSVLESGAQEPPALSTVPRAAFSVPTTLHASLMARLDRLGSAAKDVAQTGATIGREFGLGLLAFVTDLSEPQLREALDRLVRCGRRIIALSEKPASDTIEQWNGLLFRLHERLGMI
jgi:hypothetical protein